MRKIILIMVLLTTIVSYAAPAPALVPSERIWTINTTYEHPKQLNLHSLDGQNHLYWYTIISIVNNTGDDVMFYPNCQLVTDTAEILSAGRNVMPQAFAQIKSLYKRTYPFLELLERVDSKLLQGQDNAKDIAIIWPDFDPNTKQISIYIAGLSNETKAIDHPTKKDKNGKPIKVFLRKTLQITYDIAGDSSLRQKNKLTFKEQKWVLR